MIANIVPDRLKKLVSLALAGDYEGARKVHLELFKLSRVMFVESNPIPVKTAMGLLGISYFSFSFSFILVSSLFFYFWFHFLPPPPPFLAH